MKRLFLAFNLTDAARDAVVEAQERVKTQFKHSKVSWVDPVNFHVTVHFIGDFPEHDVSALTDALHALDYPPTFDLELTELSAFPDKKNPHVLFVDTTFRTEGFGVVKRMANVLAGFGIEIDKRPWKPHITIGRINKRAEVFKPEEIDVKRIAFDVDCVSLYESTPSEQGSVYTELDQFAL